MICKRNINIDLYQEAINCAHAKNTYYMYTYITPEHRWYSDHHQGKEKEGKPEETLD